MRDKVKSQWLGVKMGVRDLGTGLGLVTGFRVRLRV